MHANNTTTESNRRTAQLTGLRPWVHTVALSQVFLIAAPMVACSSTQSAKQTAVAQSDNTQHIAALASDDGAMPLSTLNGELDSRPLYFGFDHDVLSTAQTRRLKRIADHMLNEEATYLTVEGHCDDRGDTAYNLALGERRGQAAREFLVRAGVPANRIRVVSYGEELPAIAGTSEASRAKNRRDEFTFTLAKNDKTAFLTDDAGAPTAAQLASVRVIWGD